MTCLLKFGRCKAGWLQTSARHRTIWCSSQFRKRRHGAMSLCKKSRRRKKENRCSSRLQCKHWRSQTSCIEKFGKGRAGWLGKPPKEGRGYNTYHSRKRKRGAGCSNKKLLTRNGLGKWLRVKRSLFYSNLW